MVNMFCLCGCGTRWDDTNPEQKKWRFEVYDPESRSWRKLFLAVIGDLSPFATRDCARSVMDGIRPAELEDREVKGGWRVQEASTS